MTNGEKRRAITAKRFCGSRRFGKTYMERQERGRILLKKSTLVYVGKQTIIGLLCTSNEQQRISRAVAKVMAEQQEQLEALGV